MKKHHHVAFSLYNWINRTKLARGLHKTLKDFTLSFLYPRTTFMMLRFFNKSIIMYQKKKKNLSEILLDCLYINMKASLFALFTYILNKGKHRYVLDDFKLMIKIDINRRKKVKKTNYIFVITKMEDQLKT